ncbi:hypothetical protein ACFOOK_30695 [Micromonospora krabiensis]|uniref:Uncharacterized protein n=1 Tax=Micromonospora krabiensis TaxID=307121 RepID=A0A1C3N367_9ACTN|nr:hypothetical protein [Micromonospora krabiensis]SBV26996.1 hypothetical protein GA0070620_2494 [Micromonospora krabiensis]
MSSTLAALLGSAITASATLLLVVLWSRTRRRQRQRAELRRAYVLMLSGALRLAHKAEALRQTAYCGPGLRELSGPLLGGQKPLDPMVLHDWLARDMVTVETAWSEIWTTGDQDGIALANGLMTAFHAVRDAAAGVGVGDPVDAGDEILVATSRLGEARRQLALHARRVAKVGPRDVDLFTNYEYGPTSPDRALPVA